MVQKIFKILCIILVFCAIVALYFVKVLYADIESYILVIHLIISAVFFIINIYFCIFYTTRVWVPVTIINSFSIGLIPYKIQILLIWNQFSDPNVSLSFVSQALPRCLAITIDTFFYVGITFALLVISGFVISKK